MTMRDFLNTRFADPTVDFAFKRIFGTEQYKDATLGLLDSLFPDLHIADVSFPNTELLGETSSSRKGFIDVLCVDGDGNEFIVEMQNARQEHFRERTVFYSSKMIVRQTPTGIWDYSLRPTYVVAFLNFRLEKLSDEFRGSGNYILRYSSREESTGKRMPGCTEYVFLGIQDFDKKYEELETYPEKWLYLMRNTLRLEEVPEDLRSEKCFAAYFEACERAGFTKAEDEKYTQDMMNEWDIENAKNLAVREGREEGRQQGLEEGKAEEATKIAKALLDKGVDINVISECTGLSPESIHIL